MPVWVPPTLSIVDHITTGVDVTADNPTPR
jgi:hypothetical protein